MSLYLIRAFIQMRETMLANATILRRLVLRELVERLQPLLDAPPVEDETKPKIGFHPGNR